ncbi:MAG: threonylcarbamoyl-AMP synthase, partial [Betaproteobacteria bacterium]|nr:threonylcarbamoyl-AMP synthase [Betaproteobacteria bacterium]
RVPGHAVLQELLTLHGAPLLATTLIPPDESDPLNDPEEIRDRYEKIIAGVIDAGACNREPTTVVDCSGDGIEVVRQGLGDIALLGL